jgi:hypothetical protein
VLLFLIGCKSPIYAPKIDCPRKSVWFKEWKAKEPYKESIHNAFKLDMNGKPTVGIVAFDRLNALEKYCYQMRNRK